MSLAKGSQAPCPFCSYPFDLDALGRFGCPNCHGEPLEKKQMSKAKKPAERPAYNAAAVDRAIAQSRKPIGKKEARLIHALLKGRA